MTWYDTVIAHVTKIAAADHNLMTAYIRGHAADHKSAGIQPIKLDELASPTDVVTLDVSIAAHGLCPKLPNDITKFLSGDGTWRIVSVTADVSGPASAVDGNVTVFDGITGKKIKDGLVALSNLVLTSDSRLSDARTPTAHAASHKSGQSDAIKLDELASPTDVVTLDVSIAAHGLCPKLPNDIAKFLSGDGTWRTVSVTADVTGPASAVDGNVTVFDGITGKKIKDGLVALSALAKTGDAPTAHATSHKSGQSDAIKLDELAAPTDVTTLDASTALHGLLLKATAPAAGLLNFVGIGNGETAYTNKPLFDTTNPEVNGTAAPGTQVIAARRDHIHGTDTSRAPVSSPTFTDTPAAPTAPNGTATTQLATTAFVQNTIAYLDPLLYKGTIDCSGNPNFPAADAGNSYIVSVSGKIGGTSGKVATVGDMLICNHDGSPSGDEAAVGTYWNIITVNTGAVIGPASSTDGHLVVFDGPSGKLVKGGGAVPVVPAFETDVANIKMNGTAALGSSGHIADASHVHDTDTSRAAATALGTWGDSTITPTWSEGTPDITSTIARHVRNGNVVSFAMTFNISDGHDAVLDSISLPVATSQIAGHQVPLSSFKLYSDGVDDVMSDPFAYIDFNAATPLIKFRASGGSFPDGCTAVLNISGSYEVTT